MPPCPFETQNFASILEIILKKTILLLIISVFSTTLTPYLLNSRMKPANTTPNLRICAAVACLHNSNLLFDAVGVSIQQLLLVISNKR